MADDRKVVGCETAASAGLVVTELNVEAPMEPVLYFPMASHRTGQARGVGGQATDVIGALDARSAVHRALALNDGEAADILPPRMLVEPIHRIVGPAAAHLKTAMVGLRGRDFVDRAGLQFALRAQFRQVGLAQRNPTFPMYYRRAVVPGGTFFFTLVTPGSMPI